MGRPSIAPFGAIPIPPPGGPNPTEQLQAIAGIKAEVARENAVDLGNFQTRCTNWTLQNERNRANGLPLTAKPEAFAAQVVKVAADDDPSTGVQWVWIWWDAVNAIVCPDLPPLPAPPSPDHVHIAAHDWGMFWNAAPDNGYKGTAIVSATADDGASGSWLYVPSLIGGWFQKVG